MNKYVVAFYSSMLAELKQEIIEANSVFEAAISYLGWTAEDIGEAKTLTDLQEILYGMEDTIHVLDLAKALKTNWGGGGLQTRIAQFDSESRLQ